MATNSNDYPTFVGRMTGVSLQHWVAGLSLVFLALIPVLSILFGSGFYISFFSKVMIFAIAAVSLNFILGFGGMISFGHAAFMAIGGYSVGIAAYHGIDSGFLQFPIAIGLSALFAFLTGAICLRTKGVYFIMITLAFAQMVFFLFVSLEEYGGDDGLTVDSRSNFEPVLNLENNLVLYYTIFVLLLGSMYSIWRLVHSRFGRVIRGARSNDVRMQAIGFPTYRYRLAAYVIAGVMCGIAGALFANYANFVNPDDTAWTTSGELIFMVVLGGMGTIFGPVVGTVVFLLMEHLMSGLPVVGVHWKVYFGPFLILVVLFARGGIYGWLTRYKMPPDAATPDMVYAAPGRRFAAGFVDLTLTLAVTYVSMKFVAPFLAELATEDHHKTLAYVFGTYLTIGFVLVNFFHLPTSGWRATIGKRMLGLQMVSADGRTMTMTQAVQRLFGQVVSTLLLFAGHLVMFASPERRAMHDNLAVTRVIEAYAGKGTYRGRGARNA